jgi:hypothetical protein
MAKITESQREINAAESFVFNVLVESATVYIQGEERAIEQTTDRAMEFVKQMKIKNPKLSREEIKSMAVRMVEQNRHRIYK